MFFKTVFCAICLLAGSWPATAQTRTPFRLFEAMNFAGGPDFRSFGFEHLTIVDPHVLGHDVPDAGQVQKALARPRSNEYLNIDIESWPLEGPDQASSIAKYQKTLSAFRKADPSVKLGLYAVLPIRDHWRAIGHQGAVELDDWKQQNTKIASSLVPYVDALFPSLYTFYGDKDAWVAYAQANIGEARRISQGKPVYCFLWPQFHKTFAFLPGDLWYAQLDTCRRLADGIVIWGTIGSNSPYRPAKWDEKAEWWQATLSFLRELRKIP
ncbi:MULTISPECIES: hypothetical protein [unclassified Mesorhizobium]|uniref:hypothetical protein n=1 Tax=Mesorhizobium sp. TaxID=1871066 RepID=UPI000FE8F009|nr:hypothetical protein [Mesorhizobium sp.]RWD52512.1 MAG: hypothetical protein EOS59_02965 [Mesorhizobium sp.]RWE57546.1 MAG: hypothetical protein EOS24_19595 [Mesorhizobium sp.]RWF08111.1 MAG: hypothetical protein EOS69_25290 [Mesorhizobium sp.]RWF22083.1 MAG: hypothetical protein EOS25_02935 [Mesorhizobium sp.]TIS63184.1 MAG: hypothetical protein E5W92_28390 [Mesorhizobium sp.]